jgi:hypothetical protein
MTAANKVVKLSNYFLFCLLLAQSDDTSRAANQASKTIDVGRFVRIADLGSAMA